eukprot:CAMPEP_0176496038 /NCGR_PEP_ID=MMETSP0200_2-20121128/10986_1 /TAXON_ID=947934 /ORGANISM="Chaetoceros sp., Strain GSL56" /LENGTH=586 /DNA_ID=CAMNT_0017893975 /DNA_START=112 /DNA_END=1872 /DNA_ORIENTATION=+
MNNHQQDQRKKYDMQQAHIMRGGGAGTFLSMNDNHNHTTKKTVPSSSSSSSLSKDEIEKQVFKALEDLDRAEMMASRRHGEDEMIAIHQHQHQHQHQLEHARDLYRQAIGRLLEYVNYVSHNSNSNRQYDHGSGSGTSDHHPHHHDFIQIDVLKERIKLALTHAEEIQETLLQHQQQQQQQQQQRPIFSQARGKEEPKRRQFILGRSKSENMNGSKKTNSGKPPQSGMNGTTLVSSASADDDDAAHRKSKNQSQSRSTKRSNLNYSTNDPFIQIIKKDMYIDSKTVHTTWNDISGLKSAKQALQEAAILPLLRPDLYTGLRSAPRGILLYGPPGTGKTMLVRAVAHESQCILFACSASSMTSKWVGEAEKLVRTLFRMAADVAPSIIFLDELDALLGRRKSDGNSEQESSRRFKTEFMIQVDGLAAGGGGNGGFGDGTHPPTLLIGCTNCPWDVDDAVMRRFQRRIYVPLPDKASRKTLWENLIDKSKGSAQINSSRDLRRLVDLSEGFSCSDISSIANEAAFGPLRDLGSIDVIKDISVQDVRPIQMKDFEGAIRNAKKSVSVELLKKYDEWESAQAAATAAAKG